MTPHTSKLPISYSVMVYYTAGLIIYKTLVIKADILSRRQKKVDILKSSSCCFISRGNLFEDINRISHFKELSLPLGTRVLPD